MTGVFTVSVLLPDRPGELHRISGVLAEVKANAIRVEHDQFVTINRNAAVEIRITMEAFGTAHKEEILQALRRKGYDPQVIRTTL